MRIAEVVPLTGKGCRFIGKAGEAINKCSAGCVDICVIRITVPWKKIIDTYEIYMIVKRNTCVVNRSMQNDVAFSHYLIVCLEYSLKGKQLST